MLQAHLFLELLLCRTIHQTTEIQRQIIIIVEMVPSLRLYKAPGPIFTINVTILGMLEFHECNRPFRVPPSTSSHVLMFTANEFSGVCCHRNNPLKQNVGHEHRRLVPRRNFPRLQQSRAFVCFLISHNNYCLSP